MILKYLRYRKVICDLTPHIANTAGKPFRQLNQWSNSKYTLRKQSDKKQLQAAANNKFSS